MPNWFDKMYSIPFHQWTKWHREDGYGSVRLFPITALERRWLLWALSQEEAGLFLEEDTIRQLRDSLSGISPLEFSPYVKEKAGSDTIRTASASFDPVWFRTLAEAIMDNKYVNLSVVTNAGEAMMRKVEPLKLEYNGNRGRWYVLWVPADEEDLPNRLCASRLDQITDVISGEHCQVTGISRFEALLAREMASAIIVIRAEAYRAQGRSMTEDLRRVLLALAVYDKEAEKQLGSDDIRITVHYRKSEEEDLLQKIRMLGEKVMVLSPASMRARMKDTSARACGRYAE